MLQLALAALTLATAALGFAIYAIKLCTGHHADSTLLP